MGSGRRDRIGWQGTIAVGLALLAAVAEAPAAMGDRAPPWAGPPSDGPRERLTPRAVPAARADAQAPTRNLAGGPAVQGISVAIEAPTALSDVGVPIGLEANVTGGVPPFQLQWNASDGTWATGPSWSITSSRPQAVMVEVAVLDASGATASSTLQVSFVAGPVLSVVSAPSSVDAGIPFALDLAIAGGVPPLQVDWQLSPSDSNGTVALAGPQILPVEGTTDSSGPVLLQAQVIDSLGIQATLRSVLGSSYDPPTVELGPSPAFAEALSTFRLSGKVIGGAAPVDYSLLPGAPSTMDGPSSGVVAANGSFSGSLTFDAPGNGSLIVDLTDAAGANASLTFEVTVLPSLEVDLAAPPTPSAEGSSAGVFLTLSGGSPPYEWVLLATGEAALSGEVDASGNVTVEVPVGAGPSEPIWVGVTDGLGGAAVARSVVLVASPGPGAPGGGTSAPASSNDLAAIALAVGLLVGALLALAARALRGRRSEEPSTGDAAEPAVLRLLEGAGEFTEEEIEHQLGEVDGLDLRAVRAAVRSLRAARRILADDERPPRFRLAPPSRDTEGRA